MPSNITKDFKMVKRKTEDKAEISEQEVVKPAKHIHAVSWGRGILWLAFLSVFAFLWFNPEAVYETVDYMKNLRKTEQQYSEQPSVRDLQKQISMLESRIYSLNIAQPGLVDNGKASAEDVAALHQRFDNMDKQTAAIIDSKADSAVVMGMVNRLDKLEQRLDSMAKVSDQGALILTAAMMIKESAERGNNFEYEAEILSQLSAKEDALKEPAAEVLKYANHKIPSSKSLESSFNEIYAKIVKAEKEKMVRGKDWKERLNIKLKEYVQVKRTDKDGNVIDEEEAGNTMDLVDMAVNGGQFAKALELLDNPENQTVVAEYPDLKEWMAQARIRVDFYAAISKISTCSLALMKLNYVKKDVVNE